MAIYVPKAFAVDERAAIARLIHDHPFATLVTPHDTEPLISHVPLVHISDCEPHGTLLGHFARANPHSRAPAAESIAIFHGPHAYVSPSWYAEPAAAVPTWNYAVVHVHGTLQFAEDPAETRAIIDHMVTRFESRRPAPWSIGLDPKRLDAMVGAILGFRLRVKRLDAKFKLSQNRTPDDARRVAGALEAEGYAEAEATAAWMRSYGNLGDDAA
jgi:transcriptional regulator